MLLIFYSWLTIWYYISIIPNKQNILNYSHRKSIGFLWKISILSLCFLLALNLTTFAQSGTINSTLSNSDLYTKTHTPTPLAVVWVAIATRLGTQNASTETLPQAFYNDAVSFQDILDRDESNPWVDDIISSNMLLIKEYRNISSTDIQSLLSQSYDKQSTLKAYLETLQSRFNIANRQIVSLQRQQQVFESSMSQIQDQIENLKTKIGNDFSSVNTLATQENIDEYLVLKNTFYTARTYSIFIAQFIEQYEFLNAYNIQTAQVLIDNSDAIIKDAYIVIPESWDTQTLQELNLLFQK